MHALLAKPLPSAQVHQARAEARAEAEAAAEQRLAALDQARREEREAAVREALALGVRRVRAPGSCHRGLCYTVGGAAGGCAILSELVCTLVASSAPVCRAAAERTRQGSWHDLLARRCMLYGCRQGHSPHGMIDPQVCPVTAGDNASRQGADKRMICLAGVQH